MDGRGKEKASLMLVHHRLRRLGGAAAEKRGEARSVRRCRRAWIIADSACIRPRWFVHVGSRV